MTVCSIDACGREVEARGWCYKHWRRWKSHGDPMVLVHTPSNPTRRRAQRQAQKRKYRERRVGMMNALKLTAGCVDCGYDAHAVALQFDHRDPATKVGDVSWIGRNKSRAVFFAEVVKCDVRCANCHAVRTRAEGHDQAGNRARTATAGIPLDL